MARRAVLALPLLALAPASAEAFAPRSSRTTGTSFVDAGVRTKRGSVGVVTPPAARGPLRRLTAAFGRSEVMWDAATGVPLRIWGFTGAVPNDLSTPAAALRSAREVLANHLDLLAPGSTADDLVLVGDDTSSGIHTLGFAQHYRGRPVLGGQVSFRFKHGRLAMIASEALPRVKAALADAPIDDAVARARAQAWLLAEGVAGVAEAGAVAGPFILPLVGDAGVRGYREVVRVTVRAEQPIGRWSVYLDAATGEPVARTQELRFATGALMMNVPVRGPAGARVDLPAPDLSVTVNGVGAFTDPNGVVAVPDGPPAAIVAGTFGTFIDVVNNSGPDAVNNALALPPGGSVAWGAPGDELLDAQLSAYVHANRVKQFVRAIAPDFAFLNGQMPTNVNIQDFCNAFADGETINFFTSDPLCENTARISDVVYHEFGHNVHIQGVIPGVGFVDGALSEGIADYLSATITNDSGVAPGFFLGDPAPLRELDPDGFEWHWPEDNGEVHDAGRIIGGALWDLRKALRNKHGPEVGAAITDKLWFESIRRAVDMPTMYPEVLLVDDDDGNLANGTPNECEINLAFDRHGLVGATALAATVVPGPVAPDGLPVSLLLASQQKACLDLTPTGAEISWRVRGGAESGTAPMALGQGGFGGAVPNPGDGKVVQYQVRLTLQGGSQISFPTNPADTHYEVYFGPVTPLFCTGFESSPEVEGWTLSGEWSWGAPQGGTDPSAPFTGAQVAGVALPAPGLYAPSSQSSTRSPVISTAGFPTVRLQYQRWLEVEDALFDRAQLLVNGDPAWINAESFDGNVSHRDGEWRFHDVDLTPFVAGGNVQLEFTLNADEGLEFGGWNLDELCVVGTNAAPAGVCGDGVIDPQEQCDSGALNSDTTPDACRTTCVRARCGDAVIDSSEECDDGNVAGGDGCGPTCLLEGNPTTTTTTGGTSVTDGETIGETDDTDATGNPADSDLSDRGCACQGTRGGANTLGSLGLLGLLGLRRRRRVR